ncbi:MAG TPA: choice-of-anchor J domain-containing protein, partial [Flavitalea sp.]|nr:choice-of-anchor J domain-containing protein [Flavitalea sp.]
MRCTYVLLLLLFSVTGFSQEKMRTDRIPEETRGRLVHRLKSLQRLKANPAYHPPPSRTRTGLIIKKTYKEDPTDYGTSAHQDEHIQRNSDYQNDRQSMKLGSVISSNKDGLDYTSVSPADPTIAVGPSHIIQMVNGEHGSYITVFDKAGNTLVSKQYMHDMLYTPGYFGFGDPVVLYDAFSSRYIISEFGSDSCATCYANSLVVGISTSPDPTGGWNFYKFKPGNFFIDFPKYSAWPNALFATTNDYNFNGATYLGSSVYAFDKMAMINGNTDVRLQRTRLPRREYPKFISMSPVSISGHDAPSKPDEGLFVYFSDDNRTIETTDVDSLGLIRYTPDFSNPSNTTLILEDPMLIAPFKSRLCNGSRNCIPSGNGEGYDDLSDRIMNKVYLRNFGSYESIVLNHTVDVNYPEWPAIAGIRWYELQRTAGTSSLKQQGTYAPDEDGRFLASMNINSQGQIGMVFNHSGNGKYASIYFTGRNSTDEAGKMTYFELPVAIGDAYGTFANRWGDYNELVVDPVDDSTFWLTAMYGSATWKTKISSFKLQALPVNDLRIVNIKSPLQGYASCDDILKPVIVLRNNGIFEQDSVIVDTYIDNALVASFEVNEVLPTHTDRTIQLPDLVSEKGKHNIRFAVRRPMNIPDQDPSNDQLESTYTIIAPIERMIDEGFEQDTFPGFQWRVVNFNPNSATWALNTITGKASNHSVVNRLFENHVEGDTDLLITPPILISKSDSLILSFDRAYKLYGRAESFADSLEVLVTADCGLTYQLAWKKGGIELASVAGTRGIGFLPNKSDWVTERIDLKQFVTTASEIAVAFKSISKFGQNIYLDNVKLTPIDRRSTDIAIEPNSNSVQTNCTGSFTPTFNISNKGTDTIHSFTAY